MIQNYTMVKNTWGSPMDIGAIAGKGGGNGGKC